MAKWLLFLLVGCSLPLSAGKLIGTVYNKDGRPVNQAGVFVFHEMASVVVQQGKTDRNGKYYFSVVPGPYRVMVLHPGHPAKIQRVLVLHEFDKITLTHQIGSETAMAKNGAEKLKDLLRNKSREPYRDVEHTPWIAFDLNPHRPENLVGKVQTGTRQGWQGEFETVSSVEVQAQINDQVSMHSKLTSGNARAFDSSTRQIQAGVRMDLNNVALDISAETIHDPDTVRDGESQVITLGTNYGKALQSGTRLSLTNSEQGEDQQEEITVEQEASWRAGSHLIGHDARITGWDHNGDIFARHATLGTEWRYAPNAPVSVSGEMGYLDVPEGPHKNAKLWVGGDYDNLWNRLALNTRIGMCAEEGEHNVVQQHSLGADMGRFNMQASYRDDTGYKPYATRDLFGIYMVQPLTPYSNESFYRNRFRELGLETKLDHGRGWDSTVYFRRSEEDADLLYNNGDLGFKDDAGRKVKSLGYAVEARRMGARLELVHSMSEAEEAAFATSELAYGQTLLPMRNKGMIFQLELRMKNNPAVPAWWLLEEGPWLAGDQGLFYEGQLSLQF
ncbi:MAG: carboxypeptidase-like regulatory domain-containing protein [Acidobacteriota bacterium]|nr:carboxypeptidase-like regulatory domain-containing protein [Acidobacteriota bacterium]